LSIYWSGRARAGQGPHPVLKLTVPLSGTKVDITINNEPTLHNIGLEEPFEDVLISLTQNGGQEGVDKVVNTYYEILVAGNLTNYAAPQKS
jgi:hypothetical protein